MTSTIVKTTVKRCGHCGVHKERVHYDRKSFDKGLYCLSCRVDIEIYGNGRNISYCSKLIYDAFGFYMPSDKGSYLIGLDRCADIWPFDPNMPRTIIYRVRRLPRHIRNNVAEGSTIYVKNITTTNFETTMFVEDIRNFSLLVDGKRWFWRSGSYYDDFFHTIEVVVVDIGNSTIGTIIGG